MGTKQSLMGYCIAVHVMKGRRIVTLTVLVGSVMVAKVVMSLLANSPLRFLTVREPPGLGLGGRALPVSYCRTEQTQRQSEMLQ